MAEAGSGRAAANNATVDTSGGAGAVDPVVGAVLNLRAAQAKVRKQEDHLAAAKKAVTEAKAQMAAAKKSEG